MINDYQSAYLSYKSTEAAPTDECDIFSVHVTITWSIIVLIDMSAAFDTLNHSLIYTLSKH